MIVEHIYKPRILVSGPDKGGALSGCIIRCMLWSLGATAIYRSPKNNSLPPFDGLLLMGGADIQPSLYGQKDQSGYPKDLPRDQFELKLLERAFNEKKPVLGICRGMQLMNVARKGTLHQEISNNFDDFLPNTSLLGKIIARHTINIKEQSLLHQILRRTKCRVNSLHHQGIDGVGVGFQTTAMLQNGIIQALETYDGTWQIGVQWHPEYMIYQKRQRAIFSSFVAACCS